MPPKKNKEIKNKTIAGLLKEACFLFKEHKFEAPEMEVEILLSYVLKKERVFTIAHPEYLVSSALVAKFQAVIKQRLAGYSSAVIIGHKEFYGLKFLVNKDVLIPRPETEILVDAIIERVKETSNNLIIDIGTGSGAIIISLFKNTSPENIFYASDKSAKALIVAQRNAKIHQAKINFLAGDLLVPYLPVIKKIKPTNLIIAANLPYLKPEEMIEPSIKKEPKKALLSGSDGLWHYKRLFAQIYKSKITNLYLICEINHVQAKTIKESALKYFPKAKTSFKNDYTSRIRFFILEI